MQMATFCLKCVGWRRGKEKTKEKKRGEEGIMTYVTGKENRGVNK